MVQTVIGRFTGANFTPDWQTYYGSVSSSALSRDENTNTMLLDPYGNIYVAGGTNSGNYEVVGFPALQVLQGVAGVELEPINLENGADTKLYPNPFTNEFSVLVTSEINRLYSIEISDMNGVVVSSKTNLLSNEPISMGADLSMGIYIVKLISGSELKTYKLIKTN